MSQVLLQWIQWRMMSQVKSRDNPMGHTPTKFRCLFWYTSSYRVHKFLMLVVVSGLVRLTSSFIQGRVYRDTDAPNMTRCRIVSTDPDPG